jgi:hypothetical protein
METLDIVLCSSDDSNLVGRADEISIRLPSPVSVGSEARICLQQLLLSHASKGPFWVSLDVGQPSVVSNGAGAQLLGIYHCDGSKLRTYVYPQSPIFLPLRTRVLTTLTLKLFNPQTKAPITIHRGHTGLLIAHLQISFK